MSNIKVPNLSVEQIGALIAEVAEVVAAVQALKGVQFWDIPAKVSAVLKETDELVRKVRSLGIQLPANKTI